MGDYVWFHDVSWHATYAIYFFVIGICAGLAFLSYGSWVTPELRPLRVKAAVVSFVIEGIHPHDLGTILDMEGVAIRTGHHCAMPVMEFFRVPATARASFGVYNTREEIDALIGALHQARRVMG